MRQGGNGKGEGRRSSHRVSRKFLILEKCESRWTRAHAIESTQFVAHKLLESGRAEAKPLKLKLSEKKKNCRNCWKTVGGRR